MDTVLDNGGAQVTSLNADNRVQITDADGKQYWISENDLRTVIMKGMDINTMMDGVFIMYHRKSDNYVFWETLSGWASKQSNGEVADGVIVANGGKMLVVAPTESSLTWSSAPIAGGGVTTTDRVTALNDWEGKTNTASQAAKPECSSASHAPGYCNLYSRTNANGQGLTAGKWWLPSLGEMLLISANLIKINSALKLISGANLLSNNTLWTSTEFNEMSSWGINLYDGYIGSNSKATQSRMVRPVSAFTA